MFDRHGSRASLLLSLGVFGTALTIAVLRISTLSQLLGVRLRMPWVMNDFKTAIYCPVSIFFQGGNPYDRQQFLRGCPVQDVFPLYLPSTLILHAPWGLLPIETATLGYFGLSVVLSLAIVFLSFRLRDGRATAVQVLLGAGLLLLSRPGQWNLLLGQPSLELAIATYLALYLAPRAPMLSGLALAVTMYKPTFGIPLGLLMLVRGDRRAVLAGAAFTILTNAPPLLTLMHRAGGWQSFLGDLQRSQQAWQGVVDPASQVYGVDTPGLLSRFLGSRLQAAPYLVVSLAVLGAAAAAVRTLKHQTDRKVAHLSLAIICLAMLVSVHHQAYDLVLLVAPVIAIAGSSLPAPFLRPRRRLILLTLFALLGLNYITTLSVLHRLEQHRAAWLVLASLNGAFLLALFLGYIQPLIVASGSATQPVESLASARVFHG
jgi:hypothetical protein